MKEAFLARVGKRLPKGVAGSTLTVSDKVSKMIKANPERVTALLEQYGEAVIRSSTGARAVSFRVDVDPAGTTTVTPVEETTSTQTRVIGEAGTPDPELQHALAAARARGRLRAAEILTADDMLSAEAFAELLGTTRVTVNTKRQSGQLLGLDGAKRGFRFPVWQLDADGRPYAELAGLHERLGGAWAVYRFLVQPHGELEGLTGRDALERGKTKAALEVAKSVGRDFR
ncbi:XRE family transcriptional regulator [Mesorhizobium australicum]|uniref:XRE family transcriptional regulator n=1 Tax=Mesorhizobium australicum TaxID=536018 RepID=UPI00333B5BD0